MFVVPDVALERRRAQNRIAQRRFREKKSHRKAAADSQKETTPIPAPKEHRLVQDHAEGSSLPGPEDRWWWSAEPASTMGESTPTSHASTASPGLESASVPHFNVSKGALLTAQGLLMGNIDFLSFDQAVGPLDEQARGPSSVIPLLTPPSCPSASPVETLLDLPEPGQDEPSSGAARIRIQRNTHTHAAPPPADNKAPAAQRRSALPRRASTAAASVDFQPVLAEELGAGRGSGDNTNDNGHGGDETPWLGPLHMAAIKGHDRIVRILLGHTADANEPDGHGRTPMMHAVAGGFEDVLQTLLAHGARVADTDPAGRSVIHWAVAHRRESLLRRLLKHCRSRRQGAGALDLIDRPDASGTIPLHLAIDIGFEAGVVLLLEYGASPCSRSRCAAAEDGL